MKSKEKEEQEQEKMDVQQQSSSSSFLVRVWQETGEDSELRFYLRNLKTGEERYLGDAERIGELLTAGLGQGGSARQHRKMA